jgi:hypothetical protein
MKQGLTRRQLIAICLDDSGLADMHELLEYCVFDSVVVGACKYCGHTCEVEPDCGDGWCEVCDRPSVLSVLILAGLI